MQTPTLNPHNDGNTGLEYDLFLIGSSAWAFYDKNRGRLHETSLQEYSSHAIEVIETIIDKEYGEGGEKITSDAVGFARAARRAKDNIARARHTVESEANRTKTSLCDGGFWWFYKQVVIYSLDTVRIVVSEHKKIKTSENIYDHTVGIEFCSPSTNWLYMAHIKQHKEISIVGNVNGLEIPNAGIETITGKIHFLLNRVARIMALNQAITHIDYITAESPTAKRAKAIANFLKGDYTNKIVEKTAFDELKIID